MCRMRQNKLSVSEKRKAEEEGSGDINYKNKDKRGNVRPLLHAVLAPRACFWCDQKMRREAPERRGS